MPIQAAAVFCGSKSGINDIYKQDAQTLGKLLGEHGIQLIYGGGRNGLMGYVADAAMNADGTVRGIIPQLLADWESSHDAITELTIVESMHERKRRMYELCDAAVVLPGGFGTLDELFEILTWNGLALHNKKVFILNSGGFYTHLLQHLEHVASEGFMYGDLKTTLTVLNSPEELKMHLF